MREFYVLILGAFGFSTSVFAENGLPAILSPKIEARTELVLGSPTTAYYLDFDYLSCETFVAIFSRFEDHSLKVRAEFTEQPECGEKHYSFLIGGNFAEETNVVLLNPTQLKL